MNKTKQNPTTGEKVILPLTKSNLIFPHSYNITLSASLLIFSFTHRAQRITDTSLLYKARLKKIHKWV